MYNTVSEAKEAASKFVGNYDVPPVITETKTSQKARRTTYNFRFLVNEAFVAEWTKDHYGHYHRMIEVLRQRYRRQEK